MLALVVNPRARAPRRDPELVSRLAFLLGTRGELRLADGDPAALAEELAQRKVARVAICGGDGTGQALLSALLPAYRASGNTPPAIVPLGGGTINTIARNLGVRGSPEQILARLVATLDAGAALPTIRHPLVTVNGRRGFLFAAALGARFLELYYDTREPGPARAARLAIQVSASALLGGALTRKLFHASSLSLELEGEPPRRLDARLLVASTIPEVGVGMRVCRRGGRNPRRFHLFASSLSPLEMGLRIPAVQAGTPVAGPNDLDALVSRARLRFDAEEPYTLDGDLFHARELELGVDAIEIVRP